MQTYFTIFTGLYHAGAGARRDEDGYYWITGRVDDAINVAGHRLGTAEVESASVAHPTVSETAVVGYSHELTRPGHLRFVTLQIGIEPSDALRKELAGSVGKVIAPTATPDFIQWAPRLPKTGV